MPQDFHAGNIQRSPRTHAYLNINWSKQSFQDSHTSMHERSSLSSPIVPMYMYVYIHAYVCTYIHTHTQNKIQYVATDEPLHMENSQERVMKIAFGNPSGDDHVPRGEEVRLLGESTRGQRYQRVRRCSQSCGVCGRVTYHGGGSGLYVSGIICMFICICTCI